jgi:hypothetical protein
MCRQYYEAILIARDYHRRMATPRRGFPRGKGSIEIFPLVAEILVELQTVTSCTGFEIIIEKTPMLRQLYGMYLRYPNRAEIFISNTLDSNWARFVTCKELMHLVCDDSPKHYARDPYVQVELALRGKLPAGGNDSLDSEEFAFVTAIELMYPWHTRYLSDGMPDGVTSTQIADAFGIPAKIVDLYYSGSFARLSEAWNVDMKLDHFDAAGS